MRSLLASVVLAAATVGAALGASAQDGAAAAPAASPAASAGEATFLRECGMCHLPGGTGTMMLERRLGPDQALLAKRDDLPPQYIDMVVRRGINSMPTITRVELPDSELQAIVGYLTRNRAERAQ